MSRDANPRRGPRGTWDASRVRVEIIESPQPPRRWSKRRLLVVVSSLIAGVALLTVSVVGVAHSFGFAIHAADAMGDVGEIAPERAAPTGRAVTGAAPVSTAAETRSPAGSSGGSSVVARASSAAPLPAAPVGGVAGASGGGGAPAVDATGSIGGGAGTGGAMGGMAGAAPTAWENAVKDALGLIAHNTISMCGRNTCNTGQVCCNASCGVCVAPGETCDQQQCAGAPRTPTAVLCGRGQCNDGQVCCNASCGTCAAPGETCSDKQCQ